MVISDSEEALLKCFNHFANLLSHYRDFDARKQLYAKTKHFYELMFAAATAILYATNFFFATDFFSYPTTKRFVLYRGPVWKQ